VFQVSRRDIGKRGRGHSINLGLRLACTFVVGAVAVAGCASADTPQTHRASVRNASLHNASRSALNCATHGPVLKLSTRSARTGQDVTVYAPGPWPRDLTRMDISVDTFGAFGKAVDGQFRPLFYLGSSAGGSEVDIPVGSHVMLAGTGSTNDPFKVEIPPVPSGRYIIGFEYTIILRPGPRNYELCASIDVRS
jgi:hypothetical protein